IHTTDDNAGRSATCPKCGAAVVVPSSSAASEQVIAASRAPAPLAPPPRSDGPTDLAVWLLEAGRSRCESCGVEAPTMETSFSQHIGAIVLMFHREYKGVWCKRCIHEKFW